MAVAPRRDQGYITSHRTYLVSSPDSVIQTADLIPESLFSFLSMFVLSHMGFRRNDLHLAVIPLKRPSPEAEPMDHLIFNFQPPKLSFSSYVTQPQIFALLMGNGKK